MHFKPVSIIPIFDLQVLLVPLQILNVNLVGIMKTRSISSLLLVALSSCNAQQTNETQIKSFQWKRLQEPHNSYSYHIALSYEDEIFAVGGNKGETVESYDVKSGIWKNLAPVLSPRIFFSGAMLENSIFVIGGMDSLGKYTSTVERYDILTNKWSVSKAMSVSRCRFASTAHNGKIYAIGGLEGVDDTNLKNSAIVEEYDPKTNSWTRKADMPTPRHGHSIVVIGDNILVIGGYTENGATGVVEQYDAKSNKWTSKSNMPTPRGFFGLVAIGMPMQLRVGLDPKMGLLSDMMLKMILGGN